MSVDSKNKVANATEADWSFMKNSDVLDLIMKAATQVTYAFSKYGFDVNDVYHEGLLYVSVRPELVNEGDTFFFLHVKNGLKKSAMRESKKRSYTSVDAMIEAELA